VLIEKNFIICLKAHVTVIFDSVVTTSLGATKIVKYKNLIAVIHSTINETITDDLVYKIKC